MALTIELEGTEIAFEWPNTFASYPIKNAFKLSDFGIGDLQSSLYAAEENPDGPEAKSFRFLQDALVEMAYLDKERLPVIKGGKTVMQIEEKLVKGKIKKVQTPKMELRPRHRANQEDCTTRLPNSVNMTPGVWVQKMYDWKYFRELAGKLRFLDDTPNPGVPLHPNDEAQFKVAHAQAISDANPRRRKSLTWLATIKTGKYTAWDGISNDKQDQRKG